MDMTETVGFSFYNMYKCKKVRLIYDASGQDYFYHGQIIHETEHHIIVRETTGREIVLAKTHILRIEEFTPKED